MSRSSLMVAILAGVVPALAQAQVSEEVRRATVDSENVLGTSMHLELAAEASKLKGARKALTAEIERLDGILSTWNAGSELRRLPRPCPPTAASVELREVLAATERWMGASGGAFHPGVEVLMQLWKLAETRNSEPSSEELAAALARIREPLWKLDEASATVAFLSDVPLSFDGLAKGYIIYRAIDAAVRAGARDLVLDIGGDVRVVGKTRWTVAVADPRAPADNAQPLCKLELENRSVATSGGYARGFDIAGKHFSHIFDPRTGKPVTAVQQATVIAPDATTADALATALNVLAPGEGLALVAKLPGVASMVVDAQGVQHASPDWARFVRASATAAADAPAASGPSVLPRGGS
ncbi:MAG: FAD:protein FMN transferase [Planctomycetota bacterium]